MEQTLLFHTRLALGQEPSSFFLSIMSSESEKIPASFTVMSSLEFCSYVLLMYLIHNRVSSGAGIPNSSFITV